MFIRFLGFHSDYDKFEKGKSRFLPVAAF